MTSKFDFPPDKKPPKPPKFLISTNTDAEIDVIKVESTDMESRPKF